MLVVHNRPLLNERADRLNELLDDTVAKRRRAGARQAAVLAAGGEIS